MVFINQRYLPLVVNLPTPIDQEVFLENVESLFETLYLVEVYVQHSVLIKIPLPNIISDVPK